MTEVHVDMLNWSRIALLMMDPANTKHLYKICTMSAQRLRRWSNIVQMLYKCFVFYWGDLNEMTFQTEDLKFEPWSLIEHAAATGASHNNKSLRVDIGQGRHMFWNAGDEPRSPVWQAQCLTITRGSRPDVIWGIKVLQWKYLTAIFKTNCAHFYTKAISLSGELGTAKGAVTFLIQHCYVHN